MKKLFAIILAITLLCAVNVTVFAAPGADVITTGTGSADIDVNARYVDAATTPDVYSVDVEWGAMEFTYSSAGARVWDPATHTYTGATTTGWSASGNTVKVTNHSNKGVTAAFAFTKLGTVTESIAGSFDYSGALTLAAGEEGSPGTAANVTATLTLTGALDSSRTALTKVGTVTVTLG